MLISQIYLYKNSIYPLSSICGGLNENTHIQMLGLQMLNCLVRIRRGSLNRGGVTEGGLCD